MAKDPADVRSLARSHTKTAINVLAGIMMQPKSPEASRVAAAKELLNRGWGSAPLAIGDGDGEPLVVQIIQYSESSRANGKDRTALQLGTPTLPTTTMGRA
jgi:hypothetical protein